MESAPSPLERLKSSFAPQRVGVGQTLLYSAMFVAAPVVADAAIVYGNGPISHSYGDTTGWDIDGDLADDVTFTDGGTGGSSFCVISSSGGPAPFASDGTDQLLNFAGSPGTVGVGNTFRNLDCQDLSTATCAHFHFQAFSANFSTGANFSGIVGFQFDNGGTTNYGVMEFAVTNWDGGATDDAFTVLRWAYDDTGATFNFAGNGVPEPTTLGLVGLAAGALGLRRRRRQPLAS